MTRVGRHLSPAMARQQAVDHRGLDRLAETLRQSGPNRGNDHQMAGGSAFQPRFQERDFFLLGEEGFPASAPVAGRVGQRRLVLAESGLEDLPCWPLEMTSAINMPTYYGILVRL